MEFVFWFTTIFWNGKSMSIDRFDSGLQLRENDRKISGVIHDVKNLMGVVLGQAEIMANEIPRGHPCRERAITIGYVMDRCVDLLATIPSNAPGGGPEWRSFAINSIIKETVSLAMLSGKPVTIMETIDATEHTEINGRPAEIVAALLNICLNAVEAMPRGGVIRLHTSIVDGKDPLLPPDDAGGEKAANYVRIEINDTGTGIPQVLLRKVFDPNWSTKSTTDGIGRGMGLYRVRQCVMAHGGAVSVQSEVGQGTTFVLFFPVSGEGERDQANKVLIFNSGHLIQKIVLIDHNEVIRDVIASMFSTVGIETVQHSHPETAKSWLREHVGQASLVIVEYLLPGFDGVTCINTLRAMDTSLKFILYSSSTDGAALLDRNTVFLRKPFLKAELFKAVERVVTGNHCAL